MLKRLMPDRITVGLMIALLLAALIPCQGMTYEIFNTLTDVAVALLFFLHGAKLSRQAVWQGITHWRLHIVIFTCTFILFPALGLLSKPILEPILGTPLYLGFLFLCFSPSTVQSSIAFTSIAKGNIAAAVCAASASSLLGIIITPLLAGIFILPQQGNIISWDAVTKITLLLLLPFVVGQCLRPLMGVWISERKKLGFRREDQISIMFCGSKKSLASGLPMLKVLVSGQSLGAFMLPLMVYHQIQLIVCAIIAQKLGKEKE